jgi:lysophospholipase L1-like esterase
MQKILPFSNRFASNFLRNFSLFLAWILLGVTALTVVGQVPAGAPEESEYAIPESNDGLPGNGPIRRYSWFRKLWEEKRSAWASRIEADQHTLVFLGDSITQGWGDDFHGMFDGVKKANRGISGDTTRGMLIRLQEDVVALNPSGVVMLLGTNDLEEGASPETIAGNVKLIIAALKAYNAKMPIVLCRVFPSSATKDRPVDKIKETNRLYAKAVYGDSQVILLDTWSLFASQDGNAKVEEFPDLLHPNEAGYAKWAAALRPILATLDYLETDADRFTLEAGYESLFNGKDLTGWGFRPTSKADIESRNRWHASDPNAAAWPIITEATDLDGQTASEDGRFLAKHGRLVVTTPPEGRRIQQLWTTRVFPKDFILKLEFRATPNADSGIFLRGQQLQCRDFLLAGPYSDLEKYKPQDWNEIVVKVTDGIAHCTCNGEVLEAKLAIPENGPIGLEGDRGQMEYRRIRIRELD